MLYGVYQDWVQQNPGDHLDIVISEDIKWQARWEKLVCMLTQLYDAPSGKAGKILVGILSLELDGVCARKYNTKRVIIFNLLSSNAHKALTIPHKFVSAFCFDSTCGIMERLASS